MSLKIFLTSKVFFKQIGIAVVIIVVVVFLLLQWLTITTNHGNKIPVPDLRKLTLTKAGEKLEGIDLEYVVLDTVDFRSEYPPYTIVEQDPLPNTNVKENRKIYIKVNAGGYAAITLPDLIQKTYRQAIPTLKAIGLEEGTKTYIPYLAKDVVLEMKQNGKTLKPGDKVMKASKIDLILGDGKIGFQDTDTVTVVNENTELPANNKDDE
ncbi:PASTA domain-containing protein [Flavobacterium sp. Sd200]|uniref:PASTA domain-containing protein n=1 Tax=Flavobacterium sp. Sd200 TaxID=2692211 RepID=UPI00136BD70C|nr:PASTA domain-containing protein [Flavobacterium sp. Sd200]MXN90648.1 PASTA domain-containing protein [Flavobacterium sp. Sd200]